MTVAAPASGFAKPNTGDVTQAEVIAFLDTAASHGPGVAAVERIETHGALVFLAGENVYKIKRAVRFSYMDFSTLELRRRACTREIEVNQPHAPDLYLGVLAITRTADGALALGGNGEPVEWAVHMRRFPDGALLSRVVAAGAFDRELARQTADAVIDYHRSSVISVTAKPIDQITQIISELADAMRASALGFDQSHVDAFDGGCRRALGSVGGLLEKRATHGFVRRCHGDLHLANIVLWQGRPTLFDAIEFDEGIATVDTLYDLAFLLMDLEARGQREAANIVLNRYLWRSQQMPDLEGLAALPMFLALRAGIRAMVLAQRAALGSPSGSGNSAGPARDYLDKALEFLSARPARLIAVGGLSGTGKSTLAAALAPMIGRAPGAVHLRSDLERKALFGVGETERLLTDFYSVQAGRRVYDVLSTKTRAALVADQSVVVDAVFLRAEERDAIEGIATSLGVGFGGLWLTAAPETLIERVGARTADASDATPDVVRFQLTRDHSGGGWKTIDAGGTPDATLRAVRDALAIG